MKLLKSTVLAFAAYALMLNVAQADTTTSATGIVTGTVITPISLVAPADKSLTFGTIVQGQLLPQKTVNYTVNGNPSATYHFAIADGTIGATTSGGTVSTATINLTGGNSSNKLPIPLVATSLNLGTLTSSGTDSLTVASAASYVVPSTTPADTYTGSYSLVVSY